MAGSILDAPARLGVRLAVAILFFLLLTPAGLIMQWAGRDRLRLRFTRQPSYWVSRRSSDGRQTSMTRQF